MPPSVDLPTWPLLPLTHTTWSLGALRPRMEVWGPLVRSSIRGVDCAMLVAGAVTGELVWLMLVAGAATGELVWLLADQKHSEKTIKNRSRMWGNDLVSEK
jgi:hypothetical protein